MECTYNVSFTQKSKQEVAILCHAGLAHLCTWRCARIPSLCKLLAQNCGDCTMAENASTAIQSSTDLHQGFQQWPVCISLVCEPC